LIEPTITAGSEVPRSLSTAPFIERISIGSPSAVPVPCASMAATSRDGTPASLSAALSRLVCATPLGAVSEADLPSCRTQLPSSEYDTRRPSLAGSSRVEVSASPRT